MTGDTIKILPSCSKPPLGWRCSRQAGHDGPCAARPDLLYNCPRQCCDIIGEHSHEVTIDDIDKAMASIPEPKTFADYGKTYRVLPGGKYEEIK